MKKIDIVCDSTHEDMDLWLMAEGIDNPAEIQRIREVIATITDEIKNKINLKDDFEDQAEDIFKWFHKYLLKRYDEKTVIENLHNGGEYNYITANAVFYHICKQLNLPVILISNFYYIENRLQLSNKSIDIDILDKQNGFDSKFDKNEFLQLLINLKIMGAKDITSQSGGESITDFKFIDPCQLMGFIYHQKAEELFSLADYENALNNIEKALILMPANEFLQYNYKTVLLKYVEMTTGDEILIPHYLNSLFFLADDKTYAMPATQIAAQIIFNIAETKTNYSKALKLIFDCKTIFLQPEFIKKMTEFETELEHNWISYYMRRGYYDSAYVKIKNLYFLNNNDPRNKDAYISITLFYCKSLIEREKNFTRAASLMDSLIAESSDYPSVKDAYVEIILAPLIIDRDFIKINLNKAIELARKVFKYNPEHSKSRWAVSVVYHEQAMSALRKNNLKEAKRILAEGLTFDFRR